MDEHDECEEQSALKERTVESKNSTKFSAGSVIDQKK
jgi:hypothetical protein